MVFENLRDFIQALSQANQLAHVEEELSPRYEVAAALRLFDKAGDERAIFFRKVQGYTVPIVGNLFQSKRSLAMALGIEGDLTEEYAIRRRKLIKPKLVTSGRVKEVIVRNNIDISKVMPVLTHHEKDAGPYLTSAVIVAKDPETGLRGMGIHRIQVKDKNKIGIFLFSPPLSLFLAKAEERGQPLPIAVVVGMDPGTFLASISPAKPGVDKFDVAGGLRGKPVELIKCESIALEVPANAEFVMEGQILPGIRELEGPFGESSGYYLAYDNPIATIDVISHRREPIYHALMPFNKENSIIMYLVFEGAYSAALKDRLPQLKRFRLTSTIGEHAILQIEKTSPDDGRRAIEVMFDVTRYLKGVVVVDADVDIFDPREVEWAVATRFQPDKDLVVLSNLQSFGIDPSADGVTSKWGVDATKPLGQEKFEKIDVPAEAITKVKQTLGYLLQLEG